MRNQRRELLGRFTIDEQLANSIDETGLLELNFVRRGVMNDASLVSLDGNQSVVALLPSGRIAMLLLQDASSAVWSRRVPFSFGVIEVNNHGAEVTVFLEPDAAI